MIIVGITGSIGSGKSEVARVFAENGARVIDADVEAKTLLKVGEAGYNAVVRAFGDDILEENREIDKRKLATRVFKNAESVQKMNALIHPLVHNRVVEKLHRIEKEDKEAIAVIDAPLLIEAGFHTLVDFLIVVRPATPQTALERAAKRIGIPLEEAKRRLYFQIPQEEKEKLADIVIINDGTLEALREKALQVYQRVIRERSH